MKAVLHPLSVAIMATVAANAMAAEPVSPDLDELVITAKGYEADPLDTASATEKLAPEQAPPTDNAGDLFRGQPGLAVQGDGGAWGSNPVIRGLKKESVVLLMDGIRVNSAQPQGAIASMSALSLLDSVEVVKGPASVQHGTGAMGGVVNQRTPDPQFSNEPAAHGRFSLGAGTVDSSLGGGTLLQLSNHKHALILGAAAKDVDDYDTPDGEVDNSGYRSESLLAKYAYRVTDSQTLTINLQEHTDRDVWYPGSAKPGPGGNGTLTIHSPEQTRTLMALGYDAEIGPGTLETSLYRQDVERQIRAWWDALDRNQVWNDVRFRTDGARAQYLMPAGDHHLVTLGAETWTMTGDPQRFTYNPPMSSNAVANSPFWDGEIRSHGVFLQDDIALGRWNIQLGGRYDKVTGDADVVGNGAGARTEGLKNTTENLSWSTGAIYRVSDLFNPYVTLGTAYRAPDMRERFEDAARGDGYFHRGNPQLDPEKSTSVELGLKGRGTAAEYQLAAFYTRIDDYIAGRVTGANHPQNNLPIKQTENLDEVVIWGAEAGFTLPLATMDSMLPGLALDGSATWLRGENHQDDEPLYQMPAPEMTLGLGQNPSLGLYWHGQVRAVAKQDRTADIFSNGTENDTPGFATVDLGGGWKFGKTAGLSGLTLDLQLTNLMDRGYHEHLTDGDILAPGRSLYATLQGSF